MTRLAGAAAAFVLIVVAAAVVFAAVPNAAAFILAGGRVSPSQTPVAAVSPSPSPEQSPTPSPIPSPTPVVRTASLQKLASDLKSIASAGGARASVSIVELGGTAPLALWSLNGSTIFPADSTYKLPLLMAEAAGIASGTLHGSDTLCYRYSDYESGWFADYVPGKCYTRNVLAQRVAHYSDNTAAHILVRYLGGSSALNAYARSMGATQSKFFLPNTTSSADLARLWTSEATGAAGGVAAQQWLYPLLTHTYWESGIPAGTPKSTVVHKVGFNGASLNDAALVVKGPNGAYVLTICTSGPGGAAGWTVIARLATRVWQFEAARPV